MEIDKISLVNWQHGGREDGRGVEGNQGGECEGSGRSRWVMDKQGEQGKRYIERGSHYRVNKKPSTKKTPRHPKG